MTPAQKLKRWYHRGVAHGLTMEQVDAVFDSADRKYPPDSPAEPEDAPFEADEEQENKRLHG